MNINNQFGAIKKKEMTVGTKVTSSLDNTVKVSVRKRLIETGRYYFDICQY